MKRFILIVVVWCTTWSLAGGADRALTQGKFALMIDGVACGFVAAVQGGDPRASVILEPATGSALPKKHIGGIKYEPITIVLALPLVQPVFDCIMDLCRNRRSLKTLVITEYDLDYKSRGSLEATRAVLTEVRFPAFDAASKDTISMTLVFTPESTKASTLSAAALITSANTKATSAFKIAIGSLPASNVSRVEPITITWPAGAAAPQFSNLILTVSATDAADWTAWRDSFVGKGANDDANEKSGSLDLLLPAIAPMPAQAYLTLKFSQIGIIRASPLVSTLNQDQLARFQAELYYESMALVNAPAPPLTAVTALAPLTVAGTTLSPPSPTAPAGTNPTATAPVGLAPAATPILNTGVSSANDQGGRDPKDFPRLEGTVRKTYSSIQQKTSLQETVIYTSPEPLDGLEQSYTKSLVAAGWELGTRLENNDAVGRMHQIILNWKNGLRTAAVTLTEVKAGGSEITVYLTTKI
jgi:hypothetical protein